jgi:choline-sulfatase
VCEHGAWNNSFAADPDGSSHVRIIRDSGYRTTVIGKTHLWIHGGSEHTKDKVEVLERWGFEDIHEITGPVASMRNDSPYTDYLAEKGLLETYRKYMVEYYIRHFTIRTGGYIPSRLRDLMERYSISIPEGVQQPWLEPPIPLPTEDHYDSYTGRKAEEWIQNYSGKKPFFLMVGFPGFHNPFDSPADYRALYNPEEIPVGVMESPKNPIPPYIERMLKICGLGDMTESHKQKMMAAYYAKITLIDEYIGRILRSLEVKGLSDKTWIIYNSDHGEMLGDHRLSHKSVFYEGALRIPCIIRPPKGIKGWHSHALTDQLDLAATMVDIAHGKPLEGSDGRSLIPTVLAGPGGPEAQKGKDMIFSELSGSSMIRDERYKMVVKTQTREPVELFDMESDPNELRNLVNEGSLDKVRRDLVEKLSDRLLIHLSEERFERYLESE